MISIIVPVLNEEENVKRLQENLKSLEGEFEVIFCDGGSTDQTLERIAPEFTVIKNQKGRGYQMNAGAKMARGDLLFFIHCDVQLEKNVLKKIPECVKMGQAVGYLQIRFDSDKLLMKICAVMSGLRVSMRKIVYGDQGIVIQRELFEKMGRIPELPLMEDLEFSLRLKKKKVPLQKIQSSITTSARRFEKNGLLWTMWQMQKMQIRYLLGAKAEDMLYEYKDIR